MENSYHAERDVTLAFLQKAGEWIRASGEVFIILRYLRAAGARSFARCHSLEELETVIGWLPAGCDIVVFREPQLPLRSVVTAEFIVSALAAIPDGVEYLLITSETREGIYFAEKDEAGETHAELRETLDNFMGREVALGSYPEFLVDDHAGLISASKGGIDGPR